MMIVHHLNNSRSQRILWLLEELGLPYALKRYQRDPKPTSHHQSSRRSTRWANRRCLKMAAAW